MPKEKKPEIERLKEQISYIADKSGKGIIDKLKTNNLGPSNLDVEYPPHTLLKLAYLNYYLGIFLPIAGGYKAKGMFSEIIFIDTFAGSGLVKIRGKEYYVLGSTLLAATGNAKRYKFDKIFSIEIDIDKANLLENRCKALELSNVKVINGDSNEVVKNLVKEINENTIIMLFIDPEGMEPTFSSYFPLVSATKYVDIMLNFSHGVRRLEGRIQNNLKKSDIEKMESYFPNYNTNKSADEILSELFEERFGKPIGERVIIHDRGENEVYSIELRVRETQTGSKWIKGIEKFGNFISRINGEIALKYLEQVLNIQKSF